MNVKRLQLLACICLTLVMHFFLPYAALAENMGKRDHAPPPNDHHGHDAEGHSIHELPHHIEPKENELEEVDEDNTEVELLRPEYTETTEKMPKEALFVLLYYPGNLFSIPKYAV